MALYGIEPRRSEPNYPIDEQSLYQSIRSDVDRYFLENQVRGSTVSRVMEEAIKTLCERLSGIAISEGGAASELERFLEDYRWLVEEVLPDGVTRIEQSISLINLRNAKNVARLLEQRKIKDGGNDGERLRPIKLPREFWEAQTAKREREDREKQEAARHQTRVNEVRMKAGMRLL